MIVEQRERPHKCELPPETALAPVYCADLRRSVCREFVLALAGASMF